MGRTTMLSRFLVPKAIHLRLFSAKVRIKMNETVNTMLENEELTPKKHPGIIKKNPIELPDWVITAIRGTIQKENKKALYQDSKSIIQYLWERHLPMEKTNLQTKYFNVQQSMLPGKTLLELTEDQLEESFKKNHAKTLNIMKRTVYFWKAIDYNHYNSLLYLIARGPGNYAALHSIFNEISVRDEKFEPKTLFDFGSGVGTVIWAASQFWIKSLQEYFCVDSSSHMNDLAVELIRNATPKIKTVYHRQFFPVARDSAFDIVVSAYSLMELPSAKDRLDTVLNLWRKTGKYLVIVEQGSKDGFKIVNEVRDFLLLLHKANGKDKPQFLHVFAPCSHDLACPRQAISDTSCHFEARYSGLAMFGASQIIKEHYSYLVIRKGNRYEGDEQWPRIIEHPLCRSKHVICRMCTEAGKLQEVIFTASKHGKFAYRCAKSSKWGDRLPFKIEDSPTEESDK